MAGTAENLGVVVLFFLEIDAVLFEQQFPFCDEVHRAMMSFQMIDVVLQGLTLQSAARFAARLTLARHRMPGCNP